MGAAQFTVGTQLCQRGEENRDASILRCICLSRLHARRALAGKRHSTRLAWFVSKQQALHSQHCSTVHSLTYRLLMIKTAEYIVAVAAGILRFKGSKSIHQVRAAAEHTNTYQTIQPSTATPKADPYVDNPCLKSSFSALTTTAGDKDTCSRPSNASPSQRNKGTVATSTGVMTRFTN